MSKTSKTNTEKDVRSLVLPENATATNARCGIAVFVGQRGESALEHTEAADCWCNPTVDYVDPETGRAVYVHHRPY